MFAFFVVCRCSHLAVFVMHTDGHARLDFIQVRAVVVPGALLRPPMSGVPVTIATVQLICGPHLLGCPVVQNMEYKFVELLSVNFMRSSEEVVRQSIAYRYNAMKSRLAVMQTRLQVRSAG